MATATTTRTAKPATPKTPEDMEAEIDRLREDVAKLTKQLAATGNHAYSAAARAANDGMEELRVRGQAAADAVRSNAYDLERQVSDAVREKPISSLAIAAGVGFFFALLTRR